MLIIMLTMSRKTFRVYMCRKPDEFVLIWSVLHVGFSCVLEQVKYKNIVTRSISECPTTRYHSDIA